MMSQKRPTTPSSRFVKMRRWEYDLITSAIIDVLTEDQVGKLRIIEYGAGSGIGATSLSRLGDLVMTDVYRNPLLDLPDGVEFAIADIHHTDFANHEFDILVSNQVLEYLDLPKAFREMKRIGRENAYYVFAVPTATWLILSVPGQVLKKFGNILARVKRRFAKTGEPVRNDSSSMTVEKTEHRKRGWFDKFAVRGHGYQPGFFKCLKSWRVRNWETMLLSNGFTLVSRTPLLTYGSSNLPIIPTSRFLARSGLSSSFLFICKESDRTG